MNRIWAAIAILALLFGLCFIATDQTMLMTGELSQQLQELQNEVENGNMEKASAISKKTIQNWRKYQVRMSYYVPHNRLEEIGETLAAILPFIQQDNKDEALAECSRAMNQLQTLRELEMPYLNNIL